MLYTSNTFVLFAIDLPNLFQESPQAHRIREVKLADTAPVDLYDQSNIEAALAPVNILAERCDNLQTIMIPYKLGMKLHRSKSSLHCSPKALGFQKAEWDPPRHNFDLFIYNDSTKTA